MEYYRVDLCSFGCYLYSFNKVSKLSLYFYFCCSGLLCIFYRIIFGNVTGSFVLFLYRDVWVVRLPVFTGVIVVLILLISSHCCDHYPIWAHPRKSGGVVCLVGVDVLRPRKTVQYCVKKNVVY